MQRLVLGDNQFFGVNHMSEEKARAQQMRFHDVDSIVQVLDDAYDAGVRAFMCTTHEQIADVCRVLREGGSRYRGFELYPCMPYAHKYANAVTERGMLGALRQFTPDDGVLGAALKGGRALAGKDVDRLVRMLIDAEMQMFDGLATPVIFLQNVVTDLLLGLGFTSALESFAVHVQEAYGAEAGFITMNLPLLSATLNRIGLVDPIVCANINAIGFRMSGGIEAYQRVLSAGNCRAMAMSVFASGAIPPGPAIEWVCAQEGIESIVFGASSARNILATRDLVRQHWPLEVALTLAS